LKQQHQRGEWTHLTKCSNAIELGMIESVLNSNAIPVLKKSSGSGAYTEIYMGLSLTGWDIYVPVEFLRQAQELLPLQEALDEYDLINDDLETEDAAEDIDKNQPGILIALAPIARRIIMILLIVPAIILWLYYSFSSLKNMLRNIWG